MITLHVAGAYLWNPRTPHIEVGVSPFFFFSSHWGGRDWGSRRLVVMLGFTLAKVSSMLPAAGAPTLTTVAALGVLPGLFLPFVVKWAHFGFAELHPANSFA